MLPISSLGNLLSKTCLKSFWLFLTKAISSYKDLPANCGISSSCQESDLPTRNVIFFNFSKALFLVVWLIQSSFSILPLNVRRRFSIKSSIWNGKIFTLLLLLYRTSVKFWGMYEHYTFPYFLSV